MMKEKDLILNPFFLSGLVLLIANDLILKWQYSNAITGKLSDFAGLFILPIFLAYLIPKSKEKIALIIGILFMAWKSPLSTPFIEFVNSISIFQFKRIIDFSDLIALSVLPFSHTVINKGTFIIYKHKGLYRQLKVLTIVVASFSFMATSMVRFELPEGTIYLGKSYSVNMTKDSVLKKLDELGYEWTYGKDTISESGPYYNQTFPYYQVENIVVKEKGMLVDTLKNIKFRLLESKENKTKIELINVELKRPGNIQNWRYLKQMNRFYKDQLKKDFIGKIDK